MTVDVDFDADLAYAIDDLPKEVTFDGSTYDCIVDPVSKSDMEEDIEGIYNEADFMVMMRTSELDTRPVTGDTVTMDSISYRVVGVDTCESDEAITLMVKDITQ